MKEGNAGILGGQVGANPLSINIEFNINNARTPTTDLTQMIRGKKLQSDILNLKNHICGCQVSKTPQLAQTDRDTYSKEMQYLKPVEDRKRKSKRNSMDINIPNRSVNEWGKTKFTKGNTTVLKKTDISFKNETFKKKRNPFKNDFEPYKKSIQVDRTIQAGSQKKTFHKSLKNIIHKIVNNELSKRSLNYSKTKSPYTPNFALNNNTARKRTNKKKNMSCKSERGLTSRDPEEIVQKLNSLKSMTNSILRSQAEQLEMPYYSKKRGRIHIKTDESIDLIQQIAIYQKKPRRQDQRKQMNYKGAVQQTNKLIQTYLHLMNQQSQNSQRSSSLEIQQQSIPNLIENKKSTVPSKAPQIRKTISNEMRQLFSDIPQDVTQQLSALEKSQNKPVIKEKPTIQLNQENTNKLRAFLSSEMERPATVSSQLQRMKFQQLKKQQIQKWGYLLQFIKKNMHSDEADTETVLNEVYWFLQRSKNDLQRQMHADLSIEHPKKEIDDQFTVKYSQKREQNQGQYYQQQKLASKQSEEVNSFKEEYTEENEDLKLLSLQTISSALKQRQLSLDRQRDKQIITLQQKRQLGKITEEQYEKQLEKIDKWNKKELAEIRRAKKNIWKGYNQAKGVLDKTVNSRYYQKNQSNTKKMMKCLSQTYLKKNKYNYKAIFNKQETNKSSKVQSSEHYQSEQFEAESQQAKTPANHYKKQEQHLHSQQSGHSQDQVGSQSSADPQLQMSGQLINSNTGKLQQLSPQPQVSQQQNRSQQMQQIKQRLLRMKRQHYGIQEDHQSQEALQSHINYEQIQKSLQEEYSDQQISIINKEVGQSFLPLKTNQMQKFKQLENKLKYCCSEDKQDIFQFIFLDLCIELYQQPCKDNKIMKAINGHVNRVKNQAKKKKGVKTNLNVVKQYLKRFAAFLLRTNKNCLLSLNTPMGPSALQMLRYMHDSDYDIPEEQQEIPTLIIPITVFDKFQQSLLPTLEFQEYYDDPEKEQARINFLKTILHIHNKALFDSLNQFMDHQRPYGIWGKPFPWKKSSCFTHNFSQSAKEEKLKKSVQKVIEQCSYVCGLLIDKQQSLVGNAKISQAYVQQIREDRLSRMLANELVESEQRWLFYDDEETEVLVQISTYVWNLLLYEARNEINVIRNN